MRHQIFCNLGGGWIIRTEIIPQNKCFIYEKLEKVY